MAMDGIVKNKNDPKNQCRTRNPILDFYMGAYVAGVLRRPVFYIFQLPNEAGKSLTSNRFDNRTDVLLLRGDTTTQAFRDAIKRSMDKSKNDNINLILVEDACKIRSKTREDFFALCAQFATGNVSIDQYKFNISLKSHASVIINTPPNKTSITEGHILDAGAGDRFGVLRVEVHKKILQDLFGLGLFNQEKNLIPIKVPDITPGDYPQYIRENNRNGNDYSRNDLNHKYACFCAGIPENTIDIMKHSLIRNCNWSGFWEEQEDIDEDEE